MKMVTAFRKENPDLFRQLAELIAEHPVYWVILIGAAMKDDTDKYVSHFGCILHPAKEAADAARHGRLCDYVVLKRWKRGERGKTFEYALTSDPGNYFYWNWLANQAQEKIIQESARAAVGDSSKMENWADKVEAALGTCLIAERIPEMAKSSRTSCQMTP